MEVQTNTASYLVGIAGRNENSLATTLMDGVCHYSMLFEKTLEKNGNKTDRLGMGRVLYPHEHAFLYQKKMAKWWQICSSENVLESIAYHTHPNVDCIGEVQVQVSRAMMIVISHSCMCIIHFNFTIQVKKCWNRQNDREVWHECFLENVQLHSKPH